MEETWISEWPHGEKPLTNLNLRDLGTEISLSFKLLYFGNLLDVEGYPLL